MNHDEFGGTWGGVANYGMKKNHWVHIGGQVFDRAHSPYQHQKSSPQDRFFYGLLKGAHLSAEGVPVFGPKALMVAHHPEPRSLRMGMGIGWIIFTTK